MCRVASLALLLPAIATVGAATEAAMSFRNDVTAVLSKAGWNAGTEATQVFHGMGLHCARCHHDPPGRRARDDDRGLVAPLE